MAVPAATLVEPIIDLPVVLPPAVAGLALLLLLGRNGPLGAPLAAAGLELPFTTAAVVMAQTFVSAPFYVRWSAAHWWRSAAARGLTRIAVYAGLC